MVIGIMLRHLKKQAGGIGTYTDNLMDHLLRLDSTNRYVLMYSDEHLVGTYSNYPHVEEVVVRSSSRLTWDQIAVPSVAIKKGVDVIFNPKHSVPLLTRCKTVYVLQGADWFVFPNNYKMHDRIYHKMFAWLFIKKSDAIISISHSTTGDILRYASIDPGKVKTIHFGVGNHFRPIRDSNRLEDVRRKYDLPSRFILYVGQIYPMKNVPRIAEAFSSLRGRVPHRLVIVGKPGQKGRKELAVIERYNLGKDLVVTGWIPVEDLPVIYNLADAFIFPSLYEGFGLPLLEAMACGCPVVTSNRGATREITGDAAKLVAPTDVDAIAGGIFEVLSNRALRDDLVQRGFRRAKQFSWERCARETLGVLESLTR